MGGAFSEKAARFGSTYSFGGHGQATSVDVPFAFDTNFHRYTLSLDANGTVTFTCDGQVEAHIDGSSPSELVQGFTLWLNAEIGVAFKGEAWKTGSSLEKDAQ